MTHRSTAKLIEISKALLTRTKQGRVTWVPTEKLDVFEVDFPDYSIRIARAPMFSGGTREACKIEIYNNEGRLIDAATSYKMEKDGGFPEGENITGVLDELYELARRQALGTDRALDELLSRLSSA